MQAKIRKIIADEIFKLYKVKVEPEISRPEEKFGDYTSNISFMLAGQLHKNPKEIADSLVDNIKFSLNSQATEVKNVANFINIKLSDEALREDMKMAISYQPDFYRDQVVVCEYSDPNPFKILHVGHLYTSIVGNAIANLFEVAQARVVRASFGGDVGLHVARTIKGIIDSSNGLENSLKKCYELSKESDLQAIITWLGESYVFGNKIYENGGQGTEEIKSLNSQIYEIVEKKDHTSDLSKLYWLCRDWSYEYFKEFYDYIQITPFDKYYPESETAPIGIRTVKEQLKKGVFEESEGAIVFKGEKYGLHTRVFITSQGLPSYEAKDLGLIMTKYKDFSFDKSIVITGNEQTEYMKVVLKSVEQFEPKLAERTTHLTHGMVRMTGGVKISSRKGNGLTADQVIQNTARINFENTKSDNIETTLGAIKYAFLKQRLGPDIIYDPIESVSLIGNSGPYLQYSYARSISILDKASKSKLPTNFKYDPRERLLARKISEYPEYLDKAINEIMPHHVATYLYELAQTFNKFYEHSRVIGDDREAIRVNLVENYSKVLKKGLTLLSISALNQI
jgi:arginyl-tRNA synthetase